MSFYLEPPSGAISLQNLERFAEKRLDFLIKIHQCRNDRVKMFDIVQDSVNVMDSECLIGGSKKDAISHFILRLALCSEPDTVDFVLSAETSLFEFRFLCMNEEELRDLFKKTEKVVSSFAMQTSSMVLSRLNIFKILNTQFKNWTKVIKLYLKGENSYCFYLPFYYVFNLVAKRHVVLTNGVATVPFPKLREVITDIFKDVLRQGLKVAMEKRQAALSDIRTRKLFRKLIKILHSRHHQFADYSNIVTNLSHDQIATEVKLFPPCMFNLYRALQEKHRLKHHSRIQFTLFLKEIGMPVHEALMYWRKEYSIEVDNKDGCQHKWKDNEKRYFYNIRHLYGLEGAHINYRAHSCSSLQNFTPSVGEVGGCPFKYFDKQHLSDLLSDMKVTDDIKRSVKTHVENQNYNEACCSVLKNKDCCASKHTGSDQNEKPKVIAADNNEEEEYMETENSSVLNLAQKRKCGNLGQAVSHQYKSCTDITSHTMHLEINDTLDVETRTKSQLLSNNVREDSISNLHQTEGYSTSHCHINTEDRSTNIASRIEGGKDIIKISASNIERSSIYIKTNLQLPEVAENFQRIEEPSDFHENDGLSDVTMITDSRSENVVETHMVKTENTEFVKKPSEFYFKLKKVLLKS